jgi:hypothetical protein
MSPKDEQIMRNTKKPTINDLNNVLVKARNTLFYMRFVSNEETKIHLPIQRVMTVQELKRSNNAHTIQIGR